MIRIAFCDDDRSLLHHMSLLMDRYQAEEAQSLDFTTYHSPLELMAAVERGQRWDILLLDVVMPGENGMDLAREIRALDDQVKIIFLTTAPEFAVQSYSVGAYFYLLKPVTEESFFPVLRRAIEACAAARREKLILKCKTGITALDPAKLEYCEVMGHNLHFHLQDGTQLMSKGRMDELMQKLQPLGGFLRVHRSYVVNMAYIQTISYRAVTLTCQTNIPIPHGKFNEIKKAYLAYAFERERVML